MSMPLQRFFDATDKLVGAFIRGNIQHGNACNCAVGNLCGGEAVWKLAMYYDPLTLDYYKSGSCRVISKTEYSPHEIFEIEKNFEDREFNAFDTNSWNNNHLNNDNDKDGFIGLCSVFDYLISLEDFSDDENKVNLVEMCLVK